MDIYIYIYSGDIISNNQTILEEPAYPRKEITLTTVHWALNKGRIS